MKTPLVFDVNRGSTADGPGVRTTVFLKGCNLDCFWCHNPEGKSLERELAFFTEKCVGCGACARVCIADNCVACGTCAECCPSAARKVYGKPMTTDELVDIIVRDKPFYDSTGGGATISGGECMLYPYFVAELAEKCKRRGVSVAVDTAGNVPYESFETVLPLVDLFLYDVKAIDPALHKKGTGAYNARILENLDRLLAAGAKVIIRTPVIPGFNDGDEQAAIDEYLNKRGLIAEKLPYHAMGESKLKALADGKKFSPPKKRI